MLTQARKLLSDNQPVAAIALLTQLLAATPDHKEALSLRAVTLVQMGQTKEALMLTRSLRLNPPNSPTPCYAQTFWQSTVRQKMPLPPTTASLLRSPRQEMWCSDSATCFSKQSVGKKPSASTPTPSKPCLILQKPTWRAER